MQKDFDSWNAVKKVINESRNAPLYQPREVWWCSLGVNIGFEQDGTGENFDRPILIIKGFNKAIFVGVALTGHERHGKYYYYLGEIDGRAASAVLSQIRIIDTRRLIHKIVTISKESFDEIKKELQRVLFA